MPRHTAGPAVHVAMVTVTTDGRVHTIAFDRPDQRNAMNADVARELVAALESAAEDDARAAVLTGEGEAFSAGGDVRAMAEREETPAAALERIEGTLTAAVEAILGAPLPVLARVNGDAVGAATNLVAACDFAVAAEDARFGEVFVDVGLIPDCGGTAVLPAVVGLRTAKELAMTGRLFDATEAAEMGIVNRAVPPSELDAAVEERLSTLAGKPTETLALTKRAFRENLGRPLGDALEREAYLQSIAYGTEAHEEGVQAFLEDRRPEFE